MRLEFIWRELQGTFNVYAVKRSYREVAPCLMIQRPDSIDDRDGKGPIWIFFATVAADLCHSVERFVGQKLCTMPLVVMRPRRIFPMPLGALRVLRGTWVSNTSHASCFASLGLMFRIQMAFVNEPSEGCPHFV
jgi:hypothetical protein